MVLRILKSLFGDREPPETGRAYDCVMSAALDPALYQLGLAEDTFDGRFAMVTIHAALVMRRLRECGEEGRALADALYKKVFSGFDYALREKGTGDATIAKKVRRLGESFFGLARALDAALSNSATSGTLETVLERNGISPDLAEHVANIDKSLASQDDQAVLAGEFAWPTVKA